MKILFIILTTLHGLIHFMGFAQGLGLIASTNFESKINTTFALLWLAAGILILCGILAYAVDSSLQFWLLPLGLVLSQILIIIFWSDARFGTILNLMILIVISIGVAQKHFNSMVEAELNTLAGTIPPVNDGHLADTEFSELPRVVQRWLKRSGAMEKESPRSVQIIQKGKMRTKPDGNWMAFSARQYFSIPGSGFVWSAKVKVFPGIELLGRDKLVEGEGSMLIKLMGLVTVADEGPNPKANSGTMIRYLAESCWFPSAALSGQIQWREIDQNSAEASFSVGENRVCGIFTFSEEGDFESFRSMRYYGAGDTATLEKWLVRAVTIGEMNGIRIPVKCDVIWQLDSGDFKWLELEIDEIAYDPSK